MMYLRGRLQWSLLAISLISGLLAVLLSRQGGTESEPAVTTIESTVPASTTTVYTEPVYYTVMPGDSIFGISERFGLNMAELMALNNITNPDRVNAGQVLQLPAATGFIPVASPTTMLP